ncbi:MAG: sulfurtransferase [Saprospiraceae bacterium]|nr:sulfurtransferase [Saprospiraceae bacterium]
MYDTLISAKTLGKHLNKGWLIVDCRFSLSDKAWGREAYLDRHIAGSYYAHLDDDLSSEIIPGKTGRHPLPSLQDFEELLSSWGLSQNEQVVIYDQGPGGIAARLWWMLHWVGHHQVAVLDGGWAVWIAEELPTSYVLPIKKSSNFQVKERRGLIRSAKDVERIRQDDQHILIDSRAAARYRGEEEPIDPIAGHIPGAVNRPFKDNLLEGGLWKDTELLRKEFEGLVADRDAEHTTFYCGSGVTACHNILAYKHAGLGEALLYPGSWSEWINREERAKRVKREKK